LGQVGEAKDDELIVSMRELSPARAARPHYCRAHFSLDLTPHLHSHSCPPSPFPPPLRPRSQLNLWVLPQTTLMPRAFARKTMGAAAPRALALCSCYRSLLALPLLQLLPPLKSVARTCAVDSPNRGPPVAGTSCSLQLFSPSCEEGRQAGRQTDTGESDRGF